MSTTTFESLLEKAEEILAAHNESADPGSEIFMAEFRKKLAELGGADVASLRLVSWEDLQEIGIPRLRARQIAEIFREEDRESNAQVLTAETASAASDEVLVGAYDPKRATNPVGLELRQRSEDRPFVVFDRDGGVHRKATLQLLSELLEGDAAREHYQLGGHPVAVYRVGQRPDATADEHPLFTGRALRRDGSDELDLNWTTLRLEVRILLRLAVQGSELHVRDNDHVHEIFDRTTGYGDEAAAKLRQRYPMASTRYDELDGRGELPSLKVSKGQSGAPRRSDPFHGAGHKRF